jgi:hypothetical protein
MAYPLPDKPSIAVLPFDNLSGDPDQEYLADGLSEGIITALSHSPSLFVVARNSSFVYKGKPVKIQQVAEDLGVQYIAHLNLIANLSRLGRDSEAKAAVKEFLSLYPEFSITESLANSGFDKNRAHQDLFIADLRKAGLK